MKTAAFFGKDEQYEKIRRSPMCLPSSPWN